VGAASPDCGEGDALPRGEQSLGHADVDGAVGVEDDGDVAVGAGEPFDGGDGDGGGLPFEMPRPLTLFEVAGVDVDSDGGFADAEHAAGVGGGGDADHLHERVEGELFGAAGVFHDRVGAGAFGVVEEAGSVAAGCGDGVDRISDQGR
jgi:hypothetical protein